MNRKFYVGLINWGRKIYIGLVLLFFVNILIADPPVGYYDSCQGLVDDELRLELQTIISTNNNTSYPASKEIMYSEIDNNNDFITCVYSGYEAAHTFGNTTTPDEIDCEHSFCQSWIDLELSGTENSLAKADIHHLFPTKSAVNIARSNNPFDFVDEISYTYSEDDGNTVSYLGTNLVGMAVFEPADEHKGDVARGLLYFVVRYQTNLTFNDVNMLETILEWHYNDPVSSKELNRNDAIYAYQTNRNPFIDHPEFIDLIWNEEPSITVTFPNETQILGTGLNYCLNWFTHYLYEDVKIELIDTATGLGETLICQTDNDGNWEWAIPADIESSETFRIRISDYNNPELFDESDNDFTIIQTEPEADLFISEYCEGTAFNKYVEIYNGTGAMINLANYTLKVYYNGNSSPNNVYDFTGILASGEMIVIAHPAAEAAILASADKTYGGLLFNGDDALVLYNGEDAIDEVGNAGYDPGEGWDISGIAEATKDRTIIRKQNITIGNIDWTSSAGSTMENSEWLVQNVDDFNDIGMHGMNIILSTPQNITLQIVGTNIVLDWRPVLRATSYHVYSSDEPYSNFSEDNSGIFSNSSWMTPILTEKRFYRVTAE